MRTARALLVAAIVAATIAAPLGGISHARPSRVVVALRVRLGFSDRSSLSAIGRTTNDCRVKVPRGANGIAVLKTAKRTGCIDSYVLVHDNEGTRVRCVNGTCQMFWLTTWHIYYPGAGPYGSLEGFHASSARTLEFDYVPCLGGC
jgi:hypothetical protein